MAKPTKKQIIAQLEALGVTVKGSEKKRELEAILAGVQKLTGAPPAEPEPEPEPVVTMADGSKIELRPMGTGVLRGSDRPPLIPEPAPETDLQPVPRPSSAPPLYRFEYERGNDQHRGITDDPKAVKAQADKDKATVRFAFAAKAGDRVCLSWHGARSGRVRSVHDGRATIDLDVGPKAKPEHTAVALADCCVIPD